MSDETYLSRCRSYSQEKLKLCIVVWEGGSLWGNSPAGLSLYNTQENKFRNSSCPPLLAASSPAKRELEKLSKLLRWWWWSPRFPPSSYTSERQNGWKEKEKKKKIRKETLYRSREKRGGPSNTLYWIHTSGHNTCPGKKRALNIFQLGLYGTHKIQQIESRGVFLNVLYETV